MNDNLYRQLEYIVDHIDNALDHIPAFEKGKWYRYGGWGCRMQLLGRFIDRFEPKDDKVVQ